MVIGRAGGFRLRIHGLLWPVLAVAALLGGLPRLIMLLAMALCHELCHAAAARACGFHVREIEVLPIGCVARMDGLFSSAPRSEAAIALAGPFFNLLAVMGLVTLMHYGSITWPWAEELAAVNLAIALFNLLPGLPLDGGRVLRALLAREIGLTRATRLAAWAGVLCGLGIAAWAVWSLAHGGSVLMALTGLTGLFLILAAWRERRGALWLGLQEVTDKKDALLRCETLPVRQIAAPSSLPLGRLVRRFLPQRYHLVLVLDERCMPLGSVSEARVVQALMDFGATTPLGALLGKAVDPTAK